MIDNLYKRSYNDIFQDIVRNGTQDQYIEAGLNAYIHKNRLMSWLFWRRMSVALTLAEVAANQTILDFGCGGGVTFQYLSRQCCVIMGCDNKFYEVAQKICREMNIKADIYQDLLQLEGAKFDCILALDVLEHVEELDLFIDKLIELSHDETRIIVSGPTENVLYKIGRWMSGFSGDYHHRNIYDIEKKLEEKRLQRNALKRLYFPFTLFRITSWSKKAIN